MRSKPNRSDDPVRVLWHQMLDRCIRLLNPHSNCDYPLWILRSVPA
ncbi:hypothetical protein KP509_32G062700 [Ceratopteris richardii]|nr:hypothetical protein KP509_32G062700 [Ceratopteris richardii]